MPAFVALPGYLQLSIIFLIGIALGAVVNWATYRFAWFHPLEISPWGPKPDDAPERVWSDRIPVFGWKGLRREHAVHGSGFWIRPVLVELTMGFGLAMLYWWEVQQEQLIIAQVEDWLRLPLLPLANVVPSSWTLASFCNHALLITLMAAASLIDVDEKIIPDEITVPGTLLGLVLATLLPISLLPHVDVRPAPEAISVPANLPPAGLNAISAGNTMYVEPVTLATPTTWPADDTHWRALALGQACWWLWCFALTPRILRTRHGVCRGLAVLLRRVARELKRPPLAIISIVGSLAIFVVWWLGGTAWIGLLTSLLGLAVSGGLVWGVRIVGTAALHREAMGFGDVTLMMMVGTFLGWQAGIIIFFIAPFAGLLVGIVQLLTKSDDVIPYGPFLCIGALLVVVRWADVWNRCQFAFQAGWLVPAVLIVCIALLGLMLAVWQQIKMRLF
ncbi:MAG: prepilin peptidase [Bythopirellula sp.]